jgi:alanine dehydrogenase
MLVGVPKEIKDQEFRVGMVPASVRELTILGHCILVENNAGFEAGFSNEDYQHAGAEIVHSADDIFRQADMIVKVKEPQADECKKLRPGQLLFTYLHLAPDIKQAEALLNSGCIAIAYETVTDENGGLPLLTPMSVLPAMVTILGAGVVGTNAMRIALGMGAHVVLIDRSMKRLRELDYQYGNRITTAFSSAEAIEKHLMISDLVIGSVLVPGAAAPKLVTREHIRKMRPGSVVVDVSIDQGGCFETSRPTTHTKPIYIEEGVVHYCVTNMPAGVPRTSAIALNNATMPFIIALAERGYRTACLENPHLIRGMNICSGKVTHPMVAKALHKSYTTAEKMLEALH